MRNYNSIVTKLSEKNSPSRTGKAHLDMYQVQFKTDSTRSVAFCFFIYSLIHSSKHKYCIVTEQMQSSLRSACTTLSGDPYAFRSIDSSEGMLMNKGQPCILGNKDVDNGKEEENAMRKHIRTYNSHMFRCAS